MSGNEVGRPTGREVQEHTPGPWTARPLNFGEFEIFAPNQAEFALVYASDGMDEPTPFPAEANARLIAAAPDLLAELNDLYALVKGECPSLLNEDSGGNAEQDARIRAAIAKATAPVGAP